MKIVIAGVSGSLGTHLAKHLIAAGHDVTGLSRNDPGISGLNFIAHDLTKPVKRGQLNGSLVINSAAVTRDGFSRELLNTNLAIARNCLSISSGPHILVSSSSVYDLRKASIRATTEQASGAYPFLNSYSRSKFESEKMYISEARNSIILRPHALIGTGDQTLLPRVRRAMRNGVLWLPHAGRAMHEFTSFSNFAHAIGLSLLKFDKGWSGKKILNVSDGKATSIADAITQTLLPESVSISSVPTSVALVAGRFGELLVRGSREPRLSRYAVSQLAYDRTYDLSETRAFLGYKPDAHSAFSNFSTNTSR